MKLCAPREDRDRLVDAVHSASMKVGDPLMQTMAVNEDIFGMRPWV